MKFFVCAWMILSGAAFADEPPSLPIHGRIFADAYAPSLNSTLNEFIDVYTNAWVELNQNLSPDSKAILVFEAYEIAHNATTGVQDSFFGKFREAYAVYAKNGFELRAGQQILPWGKSDGINPTDYLSAKDYTIFNWDSEVQRIGAISALAAWTPCSGNSPVTFTVVVTPVFPKDILLIGKQSIPSGVTLGSNILPPTTPGNADVALKTSVQGSGWDASVSGFHGFSHQPLFQVTSSGFSPAGIPFGTVNPFFQRESAIGGDTSLTSGAWIFRFESAYTLTDSPGNTLAVEPNHWDTVAGIERGLGDRLRFQAQGYAKILPQGFQQALPDPVSGFNELIGNYQDAFRLSSTLRLTFTSVDENWEVELFNIYNFMGGDTFTRFRITHPLTEAFRVTLGADAYAGSQGRMFGAFSDYSAVFGEAKVTF